MRGESGTLVSTAVVENTKQKEGLNKIPVTRASRRGEGTPVHASGLCTRGRPRAVSFRGCGGRQRGAQGRAGQAGRGSRQRCGMVVRTHLL